MQNIFTNIKCSEIILSNANEHWYIILYDLFSRLCYIATCGPFCKDATHIGFIGGIYITRLATGFYGFTTWTIVFSSGLYWHLHFSSLFFHKNCSKLSICLLLLYK